MNKYLFSFLFICCALFSCKTTGGVFGNKIRELGVDELHEAISENRLNYTTFSSKSKIDITGPGISQSVSAQIDMVRDTLIGISLRLMGVEGARIKITPDSLHMIDRLNQTYLAKGFSFLSEKFAVDLSFCDLQELIAGNPVYYDSTTLSPGVAADKYVLFSEDTVYKNTIWLTPDFNLSRMFIEDLVRGRTLTLTYAEFDKIEGKPFAFIRTILIEAQEHVSAAIEFNKVTLNEPVVFNFTINPKYTRLD
jgi:hypothetical protein